MADILQGDGGFLGRHSGDGDSSPYYVSPEDQHKYDNLVLVEGEPFFGLTVIERETTPCHMIGIIMMAGQRFPVWRRKGADGPGNRAYYGKPWQLGSLKAKRYRIDTNALRGKRYKTVMSDLFYFGYVSFNEWGGSCVMELTPSEFKELHAKYAPMGVRFFEIKEESHVH